MLNLIIKNSDGVNIFGKIFDDQTSLDIWIAQEKLTSRWKDDFIIETITLSEETTQQIIIKRWFDLRSLRNAKLSECDWVVLPDSQLSPEQRTAWAAYRQELRDLPENTQDPLNPTWPNHP